MAEIFVFALVLLLPVAFAGAMVLFARQARVRGFRGGWLWLIAGNLLVLLFLLSVSVLAGECYYRFIFDTTDSLDCTKVSDRWFHRYWHTNPSGFRDSIDYSIKAKPGKRRITF